MVLTVRPVETATNTGGGMMLVTRRVLQEITDRVTLVLDVVHRLREQYEMKRNIAVLPGFSCSFSGIAQPLSVEVCGV